MTRRLRLEPIGPEHAQDVWLLYQDPAVVQWVAGPWSPEQAEALAVGWRRRWEQESVGKWMAYLHDGTLVGRGGLSRMPPGERSTTQIQRLVDPRWHADRLEIGWALRSEFHGQGYASEIGREGLVFAEEVLTGHAVVSFTERHNVASRRVMERIGMTYAGEILWRGLVERQMEERDDAPFAVYVTDLANP
jgi:RimJ/RimL family protein N-acetyltransferase